MKADNIIAVIFGDRGFWPDYSPLESALPASAK